MIHICIQWFEEFRKLLEDRIIELWPRISSHSLLLISVVITWAVLGIFLALLMCCSYRSMKVSIPEQCSNVERPDLSQSFESISRFLSVLAINSGSQLERMLIDYLLPRLNCAIDNINKSTLFHEITHISDVLMNKECLTISNITLELIDLCFHVEHVVLKVAWNGDIDEHTSIILSQLNCPIRLQLVNETVVMDCLSELTFNTAISSYAILKEKDVEAIHEILHEALLQSLKGMSDVTSNGFLAQAHGEKIEKSTVNFLETESTKRDQREEMVQRRDHLPSLRPTSISRISALQAIPELTNSTGEETSPSLKESTSSDLSLTNEQFKTDFPLPTDEVGMKVPHSTSGILSNILDGPPLSTADENRNAIISTSSSLLMIPPPPSRTVFSLYRKQQVWANVLKVTNIPVQENKNLQLVCVIEVKEPYQRCSTLPIELVGRLYWDQNFLLEFNHNSSFLSIEVLCQKKKSKRLIYAGRQTIHRDEIQPRTSEDQFRKVFRLQNVTPTMSPKTRSREDLVLPELIVEFRYLNNSSTQTMDLPCSSRAEVGRITPNQQRPVSMLSVTSYPGTVLKADWSQKAAAISRKLPTLSVSRKFSKSEEEIDCFKKTIVRSSSFNQEVRIRPRRKGIMTLPKDVTFSQDVKHSSKDTDAEISLD